MYYNYHSHKVYTNIRVNDCITTYEDYIARAKELGHKAVFSTEQKMTFSAFTDMSPTSRLIDATRKDATITSASSA